MTNEEAIKSIKKLRSFHNGSYGEAVGIAIECIYKQISKKPKEEADDRFLHHLYCDNCGRHFGIKGDLRIPTNSKYCCECGQAIDWSEYEKK